MCIVGLVFWFRVNYRFLYKMNGTIITTANATSVVRVNQAALMATSFISGGTNIKQIPRTLVRKPVPATNHKPVFPHGIRNDRLIFGFLNRSTITETNISAYMTKYICAETTVST